MTRIAILLAALTACTNGAPAEPQCPYTPEELVARPTAVCGDMETGCGASATVRVACSTSACTVTLSGSRVTPACAIDGVPEMCPDGSAPACRPHLPFPEGDEIADAGMECAASMGYNLSGASWRCDVGPCHCIAGIECAPPAEFDVTCVYDLDA